MTQHYLVGAKVHGTNGSEGRTSNQACEKNQARQQGMEVSLQGHRHYLAESLAQSTPLPRSSQLGPI